MSKSQITGIVLGVVVAGLITYDVWAYFQHADSTISEWVWAQSKNAPLIPFAFGVLCGHLFWQVKKD